MSDNILLAVAIVGAVAFAFFMSSRPVPPSLSDQAAATCPNGLSRSEDLGYRERLLICRDGSSRQVRY